MTQNPTPDAPPTDALSGLLTRAWTQVGAEMASQPGAGLTLRPGACRRALAGDVALPSAGAFAPVAVTGGAEGPARLFYPAALVAGLGSAPAPAAGPDGAATAVEGTTPAAEPAAPASAAEPAAATDLVAMTAGLLGHLDEALRMEVAAPLHLTPDGPPKEAASAGDLDLDGALPLLVQEVLVTPAGSEEGAILWMVPESVVLAWAGGEAASAAAPEPAAGAGAAAPVPVFSPTQLPDGSDIVILMAGSSTSDSTGLRTALEARGIQVAVCAQYRDVPAALESRSCHLVILVSPPASLAALSAVRVLAADPASPPAVVATRRPTPGFVFQAVRAGAAYVIVLPMADATLTRTLELIGLPRAA